jgi:hypothetical protein
VFCPLAGTWLPARRNVAARSPERGCPLAGTRLPARRNVAAHTPRAWPPCAWSRSLAYYDTTVETPSGDEEHAYPGLLIRAVDLDQLETVQSDVDDYFETSLSPRS